MPMKALSVMRAATKPTAPVGKRRRTSGYSATALPMLATMRRNSSRAAKRIRASGPALVA